MAIFVDHARWEWRDTVWCHLISDTSFDELHEFAGRLGCRRVGFQGDHYDIDVDARTVALDLGATACESREVVRSLKNAGLRARPSTFEKWELDFRLDGRIGTDRWDSIVDQQPHARRLLDVYDDSLALNDNVGGCFVLRRPHAAAVVVHGTGATLQDAEHADVGLFVRTDHHGSWSLESIWPPPGPHE